MKLIDFVRHLVQTRHFAEVSIPGKSMMRMRANDIQIKHGSPEEYLKKIALENKLDKLSINTFVKNGSSWIKKGFFLVDTVTVDEQINEINKPINKINTEINEINSSPAKSTTESMSDVKTEIENIKLSTELRFTAEKAKTLEERVKELTKSNERLHEENIQLIREKNRAHDEAEIKIQKAQLSANQEKLDGLGAVDQITQTINNLPKEAWILLGSFKEKNPFAGYLEESKEINEEEGLTGSLPKHTDPDAQSFIESIYNMLVNQSVDNITMITQLVEDFGLRPDVLKKIYLQLHPAK